MSPSIWQILLVIVVVILLFGRGKISDLMGDVAKGVKSFRTGLKDEIDDDSKQPMDTKTVDVDKETHKV